MAATAPPPRLDGSTPRSPRAVMSWRASSGLPAVAWAHAAQISSPMSLAEAGADERRDGGRAERPRPDRGARLALDHPGQGFRGRLAGPYGDDRARGELLEPRLEVVEEAQRGLVGPVRVVDEQGERDGLGEPRAQPVEAVEAREEPLVGRRAVGDVLEQRPSQPGRAGEQLLARLGAERLDARRQQLYHHAERELSLHDAAARTEHDHASGLRERRGLVHQRALADPGRALDHDDPAGPGRRGVEPAVDLRQLGFAFQQVGPRGEVRHPPSLSLSSAVGRAGENPTVAPRSEGRRGRHSVAP